MDLATEPFVLDTIMVSVNGYFDGNVVKPLEKIDAKPNQRVIITIMDELLDVTSVRLQYSSFI